MSRDGWGALPRDATGLSAVCDCGISSSYSLTIFGIDHCIYQGITGYYIQINVMNVFLLGRFRPSNQFLP